MKYALLFAAACTMSLGFTACSDDDNKDPEIDPKQAATLDYNEAYGEQWANYMVTVARLLKTDAENLYKYWSSDNNGVYSTSYAKIFTSHNNETYPSAISCVEQIFDGCSDIASEVGSSKIGEPYDLYKAGKTTEALYAVESWYSWHSRDDYTNNIISIRNAYYGSVNGQVNSKSLSALLAAKDATMDTKAKQLILAAQNAIQAIPQPFRNNINSSESVKAMEACAELEDFITNTLKPYFQQNISDDETLDPVVKQYVSVVVLPTYEKLAKLNSALYDTAVAFKSNPSDKAFENCCEAWIAAREPWECSEAFLFGPVDDKGLDPNMDSWPLDQEGIVNILKSEDFTNLNWEEGESDEDIEAAQALRGFHTLEYLIFKDGQARSVNN